MLLLLAAGLDFLEAGLGLNVVIKSSLLFIILKNNFFIIQAKTSLSMNKVQVFCVEASLYLFMQNDGLRFFWGRK